MNSENISNIQIEPQMDPFGKNTGDNILVIKYIKTT